MTKARWEKLMDDDNAQLTTDEIAEGWHFCREFDGLLVQGDPKERFCGQSCVDAECGLEVEP